MKNIDFELFAGAQRNIEHSLEQLRKLHDALVEVGLTKAASTVYDQMVRIRENVQFMSELVRRNQKVKR